jgi:hypothetical protein
VIVLAAAGSYWARPYLVTFVLLQSIYGSGRIPLAAVVQAAAVVAAYSDGHLG